VAGKALSADVSLVKGDVGLGNVDNTSDANKPVSTATQTALDLKSNTDHTHAGSTPPTIASLANDQATGANTTPVTLTGLTFPYAANSKYTIDLYGAISSAAATTGCGFHGDVSSAVTANWMTFVHQLANTGTLTGGNAIADDASAGVSSGISANNAIVPVMGRGLLVTGANSGTYQLRYRSETTAVTTCKAGTTIVVTKVA
jgi:hypothetical protein